MSQLVVDSAVAVKWFLPEPHAAQAWDILAGYRQGDITLLAPDLIHAEFGNVIWKKHLFHGLAADDAQAIIAEFQKLEIRTTPASDLLTEAFDLAVRHRRTVYDMLYVALSVRQHCPYVTADEKLSNALQAEYANIVSLGNWP